MLPSHNAERGNVNGVVVVDCKAYHELYHVVFGFTPDALRTKTAKAETNWSLAAQGRRQDTLLEKDFKADKKGRHEHVNTASREDAGYRLNLAAHSLQAPTNHSTRTHCRESFLSRSHFESGISLEQIGKKVRRSKESRASRCTAPQTEHVL